MTTNVISQSWMLLALTAVAPHLGVAQVSSPTLQSAPIADVQYDITFDATTAQTRLIHVAMSFRPAGSDPVMLSLPAWTPGSYELDNFARFVRGFAATADDRPLRWDKTDYDTWRVYPGGAAKVTVSFDYRADTLDTGMAWSAPDFAFFNGTNVFLYPEGQGLDFPSHVTVHTEPDWRIATGMIPGATPGEFTAKDYHELVDMPTFVGVFDLDSALIGEEWYRLATYPQGVLAGAPRETLWDHVRQMMPPMAAVFEQTPWDSYTIQMVFDDEYPGASALEHRNSHLGIYITQAVGNPFLTSVLAHEIFHAWNVKRLRPAELVPYDYGRAQPSPLLWMSEGITDYYADLALVRGGIAPPAVFYQITAGKINTVASAPPTALEDASLSTWIEPADGTASIYYPKGSLVGLLLDILIRDASDNRASLDDVMRELYRSTYMAGAGFTREQFWSAVTRAAVGRSFDDFEARYVDGREPYPWASVLPLAGMVFSADTVQQPFIGISSTQDSVGMRVTSVVPGSAAAAAGVEEGDHLVRLGEVEVNDPSFGAAYRARYTNDAEGTPLDFVVRRGAETLTLNGELRFTERTRYAIREDPSASPKAVRIRDGILQGKEGS